MDERFVPLLQAMTENSYRLMKFSEREGLEDHRKRLEHEWIDRVSILQVREDGEHFERLCEIYGIKDPAEDRLEQMKLEQMKKVKEIETNASALYLVGGLQQMMIYLDALVDRGDLTEAQADEMAERIGERYADTQTDKIEAIRRMLR